jgi:hypothetical protein
MDSFNALGPKLLTNAAVIDSFKAEISRLAGLESRLARVVVGLDFVKQPEAPGLGPYFADFGLQPRPLLIATRNGLTGNSFR